VSVALTVELGEFPFAALRGKQGRATVTPPPVVRRPCGDVARGKSFGGLSKQWGIIEYAALRHRGIIGIEFDQDRVAL
jgi:hypothetical protein